MTFPLETLFGFLQALLAAVIAWRLYSHNKEKKSKNQEYFLATFAFLGGAFFVSALAPFSVFNFRTDFAFSAISIIGRGVILLAVMFFTYIPIRILKLKRSKKGFPAFVLLVSIFGAIFPLASLINNPRTPTFETSNFYWTVHRSAFSSQIGMIATGVGIVVSLILAIVLYRRVSKKKKGNFYKRSKVVIAASFIFLLGVTVNYFIALVGPPWTRLVAESLYLFALIVFFVSIFKK